jgi:hypothetical protein
MPVVQFVSGIQLVLVHAKINRVSMPQAVTLMMLLVQDI